jgi:hypothetical protein
VSLRSEHESVRLGIRGSFVVCDGCAFPGYRYDFGFWSRTERYDILFSASSQKTRMHTQSKCEMSRPKSDLIIMTILLETSPASRESEYSAAFSSNWFSWTRSCSLSVPAGEHINQQRPVIDITLMSHQ